MQGPTEWGRLLEYFNIFDGFKHYLQVEVTAATKEDFELWEGWINSRLRFLVKGAGGMVDVRPWPKPFRAPDPMPEAAAAAADGTDGDAMAAPAPVPRCFYFMGLSKKRPQAFSYGHGLVMPQSKVDLTACVHEFAAKVKEWPERKPGMEIFVKHLLHRSLPEWVHQIRPKGAIPAAAATAEEETARVENGVEAASGSGGKRKADAGGTEEPATKQRRASLATQEAVAAVERREDLVDWSAPGEGGEGGLDGAGASKGAAGVGEGGAPPPAVAAVNAG